MPLPPPRQSRTVPATKLKTKAHSAPLVRATSLPLVRWGRGSLLRLGGFNKPGLTDNTGSPPDTTGAIGPTRFLQLVNSRAGIFNRTTGALIGSGTLDQLAGILPA
jgi:hypothetical protein